MDKSRAMEPGTVQGSAAPILRAEAARKFQGDRRGIFRGDTTQKARAFGLNTNEWNAISAEALREHQESHHLSDKEMARKIGCNDRTYENYKAGKTAPSSVHVLRCIAAIPEFQSAVDEVCALQRELDPRAMQAMGEIYTAAMKFADAQFGKGDDAQ